MGYNVKHVFFRVIITHDCCAQWVCETLVRNISVLIHYIKTDIFRTHHVFMSEVKYFPVVGDLVIITAHKLNECGTGVRVTLGEGYEYIKGMILVSEMSRSYVRAAYADQFEGKVLTARVIRTDPIKSAIDLSLRLIKQRVPAKQMFRPTPLENRHAYLKCICEMSDESIEKLDTSKDVHSFIDGQIREHISAKYDDNKMKRFFAEIRFEGPHDYLNECCSIEGVTVKALKEWLVKNNENMFPLPD